MCVCGGGGGGGGGGARGVFVNAVFRGAVDVLTRSVTNAVQVAACSSREKARPTFRAHAFRHLPPNSARFSYATEGVLFISAQLSSDAVSALRKVRVLIWL